MIRAALVAVLLALPAAAQESPEPPAPRTQTVVLETPLGAITLALEVERAPITSANFLRYVREKRLDGASFYRALKLREDGSYGLVQGGLRNDPKKVLPPIAHEPTTQTGLSHADGAISMARAAPGSAQMDFFIIVGGLPSLDANPDGPGDNHGYAVFGRVTEGMEVVRAILASETDPNLGEGVMKGQMLKDPVPIQAARKGS
ncbi:MAG: peptidylprolyl isomerase [Sphingomonadaceae bacterium]